MKKRLISIFLSVIILVAAFGTSAIAADPTPGLSNFSKTNTYEPGLFTDVPDEEWFAQYVAAGFEYGLVKGTGPTTFTPRKNVTIGETITFAARLHSIYHTGDAVFQQGDPWYQVYVDYAVQNGIIESETYADYSAKATRAQFASILAAAFPENALEKINNLSYGMIPDVTGKEAYGPSVYKLYCAGVLTGNDEYGTFSPANNIKRSEVAAIVTRMADASLRKTYTLREKPVAVTGIVLDKTNASIKTGESLRLSATVSPANATNKTVTWESSAPNVATVSNGVVTGVSAGQATIKAKAGDFTATCVVKVTQTPSAAVTLNKTELALTIGKTEKLTATVTPADAADKTVAWGSSNTSVATVSNGVVTAVGAGTATITAKVGGATATCVVKVTQVLPTAISLNKTDLKLTVGKSEKLTATVAPADAADKTVVWSSSNTSVATVSNGVVTAVGAGTATITAKTSNGLTASCTVTVSRDIPGKENYHGHVYTGGSSSTKYHYEADCAGKYSHEITWDEVDRRGLQPCQKCVLQ